MPRDDQYISTKTFLIIMVPLVFGLIVSLTSSIRAGDTKDIDEAKMAITKIQEETNKSLKEINEKASVNCQRIAVMESQFHNMIRRLESIESSQKDVERRQLEQNNISREILEELKKD